MWYKLKRIMIRPNGVEKQVRPDNRWQPWVNTIAYRKFNWNLNDSSGNWHNWTALGTTSFVLKDGVSCIYLNTWAVSANIWTTMWWPRTVNLYVNCISINSPEPRFFGMWQNASSKALWFFAWNRWSWQLTATIYGRELAGSNISANIWYNLVLTLSSWWDMKMYVNWAIDRSYPSMTPQLNSDLIYLWGRWSNSNYSKEYLSEFIIEDKEWTAQEISDYYDQTKSNYWL